MDWTRFSNIQGPYFYHRGQRLPSHSFSAA